MAVDTQSKRRSAPNTPLFVIHPVADGTVAVEDMVQAAGWYSGIAAGAIPSYMARSILNPVMFGGAVVN